MRRMGACRGGEVRGLARRRVESEVFTAFTQWRSESSKLAGIVQLAAGGMGRADRCRLMRRTARKCGLGLHHRG